MILNEEIENAVSWDLCLCFHICKKQFSHGAAHNNNEETKKNYGNTGLFSLVWTSKSNESRHEKTGFLHIMRKQRRRSASR